MVSLPEIQGLDPSTYLQHESTASTATASPDDDAQEDEEIVPQTQTEMGSSSRRGRGRNKNTAIARLVPGQKMHLEFNETDGKPHCDNRTYWSRHIGTIIRDSNMIPHMTVQWKDLSSSQMDHLWRSITDPFEAVPNNIDAYRGKAMGHVKQIWDRWRSKNYKDYVHPHLSNVQYVRANPPPEFTIPDWTYLLERHYLTDEYKKKSETNSKNRQNVTYLNHGGSRPYSQNDRRVERETRQRPDFATSFLQNHSKKSTVLNPTPVIAPEVQSKFDALLEQQESHPDLSQFQRIENVFGTQAHGRVIGMGSGIRPTTFRSDQRANSSSSSARSTQRTANQGIMNEEEMRAEMDRRMEIMRDEMRAQQEQQMEMMRKEMRNEREQIRLERQQMRDQMEQLMARFGGLPPPPSDQ